MRLNLPFLSAIGLAVLSDTVAAADCSDKAEYVAVCICFVSIDYVIFSLDLRRLILLSDPHRS